MSSKPATLAILMAGGVGSRLNPLTRDRAKPAVPFGGKYRIVDFTLSNCLHSGLRQILVLTQYKSHSLQEHIRDGWSVFNSALNEYVTCVPPQMRTGDSWYSGTADALYQNRDLIQRSGAKNVIVLSGDHVYRMNYADMIERHNLTNADLTIGCMEVPISQASSFGVMSTDASGQIRDFAEKPSSPNPVADDPNRALVSMGIYVFSAQVLCDELLADHCEPGSSHDFGKDVIPRLIETHKVCGHRLRDTCDENAIPYWRDVGTIDSYYQANMDLLGFDPSFDLGCRCWPIRTYDQSAPPSRITCDANGRQGSATNSIISSGVLVHGAEIKNSVLSPQVRVRSGAVVSNSVLFDNVDVGENVELQNCIVDKNVRIPAGETIGVNPFIDSKRFDVSDGGIVVIPRDYQFQEVAKPSSQQRQSTRQVRQTATTSV